MGSSLDGPTAAPQLTISATVVAHNEERWIADSLESLLLQTQPLDQIVVVDDGSTDRTALIARNVLTQHGNSMVISTPNRGRAAARNTAVAAATSDIIMVSDADDLSVDCRSEIHARAFGGDPDLFWHSGQMIFVDEAGEEFGDPTHYPTDERAIKAVLNRGRMAISHAAAAFRRSPRLPVGPYSTDMKRVEDLELVLTTIDEKFAVDPRVLVKYRRSRRDLSWSAWRTRTPWERYALVHASARRSGADVIEHGEWWSGLTPIEKIAYGRHPAWLAGRLRSAGVPVPLRADIRAKVLPKTRWF